MKRRQALVAVGSACLFLAGCPVFAQSGKTWRVAIVTSGPGGEIVGLIRAALAGLGYVEGKNLAIDWREANGRYAALPQLVTELIALKPDVLVAEATPAVAAAQKATSVIPIVMAPATDPVASGFVQSFSRPGGNITGVANMFGDLTAKTLDIVRMVFPNAKKIGVLVSNNPRHPPQLEVAKSAAARIGMTADGFTAQNPDDIEAALVQMKDARSDVIFALADPPRPLVPLIALKLGLPTIFQVSAYVEMGGLLSYGPNIRSFFTMAAQYTDRIFRGGKPADLPVEQPTTFEFIVNLGTAKALGLKIPEQVLLLADRVIE